MKKENLKIKSECDGLKLDIDIYIPDEIKGIVQISHGMVEDKRNYKEFMEFLANNGYVAIINDHRGHGKSIKQNKDLGYFYEETADYIVEDLHQITKYIKDRFPNQKVTLIGHSMGSLIVRKYIKKYDYEIEKLVVCGSPSINKLSKPAWYLTKLIKRIKGERYRCSVLNTLALSKEQTERWIIFDDEYMEKNNIEEIDGYIFTANGFINLTKLMVDVYSKNDWILKNRNLKIIFIAGENDGIIKNKKKWLKSIDFLKGLGYKNVSYKLYPGMVHAILRIDGKETVYKDVLEFINNS